MEILPMRKVQVINGEEDSKTTSIVYMKKSLNDFEKLFL
jgi:hypothetical protein